ncbi:hypothetical protein LguiB_006009 [Lonicera macranthoides]
MIYVSFAQNVTFPNEELMTRPNCPYRCSNSSNITIPYPFGIGANCAFNEAFVITCNDSVSPAKPFISQFGVEVLEILLSSQNARVYNPLVISLNGNFTNRSSLFARTYNFSAVLAWKIDGNCTQCAINTDCWTSDTREGEFRCLCRAGYEGNPYLPNGCQDVNECEDPRYRIFCSSGICENIEGGRICKPNKLSNKGRMVFIGTGTGFGVVFLLLGSWWLHKQLKRRRKIKLKQKFFKRNGGLLLKQELSTRKEGHVEKTKLFTSKELEKATDRYNKSRILGHGGQGTVYKGMLDDGRIVAIKMSKMVDEGNLQQFINEVVILSQINHRNIVKLHGCCLETEVPLLVYEFIPNGTLSQYIHHENEEFPLSWNLRLRIAIEAATSLSYLHSSASVPIYHRDIKSSNILLDDKYRAKVADFGTSRSIAIDQTHLTTRVLGTFGYLDPEYFQSSQFTDKSDVYSFGVVLVELLTSQKPISSTSSGEGQSLATNFIIAMEENRLFDILDARVIREAPKDEIMGVANLANGCLNLNGRKRPTMNEVARGLELIRMSNGASKTIQQDYEEVEYTTGEVDGPWELGGTSTRFFEGNSVSSSLDDQPFMHH